MMNGVRISCLFLLAMPAAFAWQDTLSADKPGPFPEVVPFTAEFRIGWSEIEAARAQATITYDAKSVFLVADGGTKGLARTLYPLDATFQGATERATLQTIRSEQVEIYPSRTLTTLITGVNGKLTSLRESNPPGKKPAKWKAVPVEPVRDFFAGMLFIRSQPLEKGDKVRLIMFPGGSAFLVDITSLGPEVLAADGQDREAIKLDLRIQRVNTKKGNALERHSKFNSGKIWLTNDADRIPLRAEVDIFIGYVFAELTTFKKIE
jgi:hypothetical protein